VATQPSLPALLDPRDPSALDAEALVVAMAVAPGAYARNRMFGFFKDPEVRRAKRRAATLRGLVRQLGGAQGKVDRLEVARPAEGRAVVRYRIASLHLERSAELSELELACVVYMAGRAGVAGLHVGGADRARLHAALRRLAVGLALSGVDAPDVELCR
jgi:hypothetical protein